MMKYLLDTHLLLWAAVEQTPPTPDSLLPRPAREIIEDEANTLYFSSLSIWEIVIKHAKKDPAFIADPHQLRRALVDNGYGEVTFDAEDALEISTLPEIHRDPFDRGLIAQAMRHSITLLTCDRTISAYEKYPIQFMTPD